MTEIITNNERETKAWATKLALSLPPGQTIALQGNLGAGKTVVAKALAKALGIKETVTSPTFNIIRIYNFKTNKRFCHIDAYRLQSASELEALGIEEYFQDKNTITMIEWADKVKDLLPANTLIIEIEVLDDNKRKITY